MALQELWLVVPRESVARGPTEVFGIFSHRSFRLVVAQEIWLVISRES